MADTFAVIFDMDGVLIDSYGAHFESWKRLAGENGCQYSEGDFVRGFGRTSREVLAEQWKERPLPESRIRELAARKEALFRKLIDVDFPAMEGAEKLIRSLHQSGFRLAVGSSGPPENVRLVVEKLGVGSLLSACVTGADVTRGKPDPQVFELAAERMDVPPAQCVVIEDAPVGVIAARKAGMRCVGVASTGRTAAELSDADLVVQTLGELSPARIAALLGSNAKERR